MSDETVTEEEQVEPSADATEAPAEAPDTEADAPVQPEGVDDDAAGDAPASVDVEPVSLADLAAAGDDPDSTEVPMRDIGLLASIDVELSVELGRTRVPMRRLLTMNPGAVIDLDRAAGTSVDILVNGLVIARGEVVVVDGDFGVRITEVLRKP